MATETEQKAHKKQAAYLSLSPEAIKEEKIAFKSYVFFLDSIEPNTFKMLQRKLMILGSKVELFFSAKCTHLVTTRKTNSITQTKNKKAEGKEDIVDAAKRLNITVWNLEHAFHTLEFLMKHSSVGTRIKQEQKQLGDMVEKEKLFGPSTSIHTRNSKRPQFVPFTGNYFIIEDATYIHRPILVKEYSTKCIDQSANDYPWPYLKMNSDTKSPFYKKKEEDKNENTQKENKDPLKYITQTDDTIRNRLITPLTSRHKEEDKRREQEKIRKAIREQEAGFCENCHMAFVDRDKHLKEKTHKVFMEDENNFKELDTLLHTIRRKYKSPLPVHMKSIIDTNIDGDNVQFDESITSKRSLPEEDFLPNKHIKIAGYEDPHITIIDPTTIDTHHDPALEYEPDKKLSLELTNDQGWEKYYNVFL